MQVTQADSSGENSGKETSIDFDSATKTLGDNPEIQPHTERFRWYEAAGIVLEVGGGIELLDGWGRGHSGNAVVGLVALGLGVGATLLARSELSSAVDIHNRSLATPPPNQSKVILPTLSVLAEHTRLTPVFGVQLEF